ncbi:helix-turn-helix transcriptional regulator [Trichocoleus sp. FACHB-262]|nr:helix-turn-helix transcriptional regulator [Trichocoleus sp. FACHB-262]
MKRMYCQLSVLMARKNVELAQIGKQLSQRQLAKDLGVSLTTVNKLYNGRPLTARIDPETVEKVCDYFKCEVGDLFVLRDEAVA